MRRLGPSVTLLLAGFLALAGAQLTAQTAVGGTSVAEQYLLAAANAERVQRGMTPLRWDAALYQAADAHAREMASRASISHQYPGEADLTQRGHAAGVRFSVIAENVAEAPTAVRIHDAWMASPGHRANLLDANVDSVGIRVLRRDGQLYAVQDFARAVADVPLAEQERRVGSLLLEAAPAPGAMALVPSAEAQQGCAAGTESGASRQPAFVMRYTTADLEALPEALKSQVQSGKYHHAKVGACVPGEAQGFSTYSLVVALYRD